MEKNIFKHLIFSWKLPNLRVDLSHLNIKSLIRKRTYAKTFDVGFSKTNTDLIIFVFFKIDSLKSSISPIIRLFFVKKFNHKISIVLYLVKF